MKSEIFLKKKKHYHIGKYYQRKRNVIEKKKKLKLIETSLFRPSMPSLHHYKSKLRKDFFGDDAGLIGV